MKLEDALRFLEHEASYCRSHDSHEALCLLPPALLRALELRPMNGYEAEQFRRELKEKLSAPARPAAPAPAPFEKNLAACAAELWRRFV